MLWWQAGTGASSEDVVEHETPHHRAAHEAHEYRRAADVLGLLRERVILERDAVDGRLRGRAEQPRDQHKQHRVDEQRRLDFWKSV